MEWGITEVSLMKLLSFIMLFSVESIPIYSSNPYHLFHYLSLNVGRFRVISDASFGVDTQIKSLRYDGCEV